MRILTLIFISFIILMSLTSASLAIPYNSQELIVVQRCVGQCTNDKLTQEVAYYLANAIENGDKIAVRLCSTDRFETAIAKTYGNILTVIKELKERYNVNTDEISLMLSNNCLQKEVPKQVATDFLVFREKSSFSYIDEIKIKNIKIRVIGFVPIRKSMLKDYPSQAYRSFVTLLRQKPNAYAVAIGYFNQFPSQALKNNVRRVVKRINKTPDLRKRFASDVVSFGYTDSDWNFEPKEPVFYVIEMQDKS